MSIERVRTIEDPGFYLRFDREPTDEELIALEHTLSISGLKSSLVEVAHEPKLLPFDPGETDQTLGTMSKDELAEFVHSTYSPSSHLAAYTYNALARSSFEIDGVRKPFVDPITKAIDRDILYKYASTSKTRLAGAGEGVHKVIIQILNREITRLQETSQ